MSSSGRVVLYPQVRVGWYLPWLLKLNVMKNENWWNGFLVGIIIGGVIGIIILDLVQRGIL